MPISKEIKSFVWLISFGSLNTVNIVQSIFIRGFGFLVCIVMHIMFASFVKGIVKLPSTLWTIASLHRPLGALLQTPLIGKLLNQTIYTLLSTFSFIMAWANLFEIRIRLWARLHAPWQIAPTLLLMLGICSIFDKFRGSYHCFNLQLWIAIFS